MKIAPGTIVTLAYDITTAEGEIVESSDISGPISILHGQQAMIPGLDKRLEGLERGAEQTFEIPAAEAFGTVDDAPTKAVPRAEFPAEPELKVGSRFEAKMPNGQALTLLVREIGDEQVTVAMVHPLAGKAINVSVEIKEVREATAKERELGRAMVKPPPVPGS